MTISRLRYWFAAAAIVVVVVVAGFYLYGRFRGLRTLSSLPTTKLPPEIEQSTQGFSLSKSEGGRTLFTVRAASATQYKQGGRAELKDVNIVVYGREANRFDQIYGSSFIYDPQSGDVTAQGVVHIDLEGNAQGQQRPDQSPPQELKNPIHLMTSGLVFNQKTGNAHTPERVEFRVPQASGWAQGATYDSKRNELMLDRDVHLTISGDDPATITATHALLTKTPLRALLYQAHIQRQDSTLDTGELALFLREDDSIDHIVASGGVRSLTRGSTELAVNAPSAVVQLREQSAEMRQAILSGGVSFAATGASTMSGTAQTVTMAFGAHNQLQKVHAQGNVRLLQPPQAPPSRQQPALQRAKAEVALPARSGQSMELTADAIDFWLQNGKQLRRAETSSGAQITLTPQNGAPGERTVATAGKFYAVFGGDNRIRSLEGKPEARVISYIPGQPERVSTSETVEATFGPRGGVASVQQTGNFHYRERLPGGIDREAWAQSAAYSPETELLNLQGAPRIVEGGMTTTARVIHLNRRTGEATATNEVKTTYSELKPQPGGALLASGDPIHVTARAMLAQRAASVAHYSGDARLWQGANIIEAPTLDFDRGTRTVLAQGSKNKRVATVLTQQKTGKAQPVNITSSRLTYSDTERRARFEGGVVVHSADGGLTADQVDVFLTPATRQGPPGSLSSSQLERIVAQGHVELQQPKRRATGDKLVYTAADDKYVLTGGPPLLLDAERGSVTGTSLTFYNRDDRVLVEGGQNGRAVTHTRVSK